jgi:hypothetical protein
VAVTQSPDDGVHDLLMANILSSLRPEAEPEVKPAMEPTAPVEANAPAAPPAPAPVADDAPAPVPPPAQPVAATPSQKKKKVRSIGKGHAVVENTPPVVAVTQSLSEPPQSPAQLPMPAPALTEDQRDELAEAAVAERLFGDRYQGHTAALKKWYQDFDARAAALRAQNPNVTEDDDEYQALLASKPAIKQTDYKKVAKTMATEAAVQETNQRLAPKLDKIEMDARRAEILPGVQDFSQRVFAHGVRTLIEGDPNSPLHVPLKMAVEKGIEAASDEYPEEATILREVMDAQKKRVHEFLLLKNRATAFNPKSATHQEIANLINEEGQNMLNYGVKNGAQHLVKDGRQFLPRDQFIALLGGDQAEGRTFNPAQWTTQRYWTFTDTAIVDIMAIRAKREAENRITYERDRAGKLGYVKAPKKSVATPQPATPPAAITPPKATPSAAPGAVRPIRPPVVDNSPIPVATVASHLKVTK